MLENTFPESVMTACKTFDVIIVGGGISGTLAASLLGKAGYRICLIDRYDVYPPDFRAEHLDGPQIEQLRRLGFLDGLTAGLYKGETVTIGHHGRIAAAAATVNYGLRSEDLIHRARRNLPGAVCAVTARVAAIAPGEVTQLVKLADGRRLTARLLILATGHGQALCRQAGIERKTLQEAHSLTFGFDIEPVAGRAFPDSFMVYQREHVRDRIDYLAAFTMGGTTRVNLFTYRDYREAWTKAFIADPGAGLAEVLPGFSRMAGPFRCHGPVMARPTDLYVSENHRRAGVALIGDAFQASCPATGMGMVRLLTDIEQLCLVHVPRWLASPGMGVSKISDFYDDPIKRACDAKALHDARYRRAVSTELTARWFLHRTRISAMQFLAHRLHRPGGAANPRINDGRAEPSMVPT